MDIFNVLGCRESGLINLLVAETLIKDINYNDQHITKYIEAKGL